MHSTASSEVDIKKLNKKLQNLKLTTFFPKKSVIYEKKKHRRSERCTRALTRNPEKWKRSKCCAGEKLASTELEWELCDFQTLKRGNKFHLRKTILNRLMFQEGTQWLNSFRTKLARFEWTRKRTNLIIWQRVRTWKTFLYINMKFIHLKEYFWLSFGVRKIIRR